MFLFYHKYSLFSRLFQFFKHANAKKRYNNIKGEKKS